MSCILSDMFSQLVLTKTEKTQEILRPFTEVKTGVIIMSVEDRKVCACLCIPEASSCVIMTGMLVAHLSAIKDKPLTKYILRAYLQLQICFHALYLL